VIGNTHVQRLIHTPACMWVSDVNKTKFLRPRPK